MPIYETTGRSPSRYRRGKKDAAAPRHTTNRTPSETTPLRVIPQCYPSGTERSAQQNAPPAASSQGQVQPDGKMWRPAGGFAVSTIKDRAMHLYMRPYIKWIRHSVAPHGGTLAFKFSQSSGAFNREIMRHRGTSGGVCQSLAAHWISSQIDGQNLSDRLFPNGRNGSLANETVTSIKALAISGYESEGQDSLTARWLYDASGGQLYYDGYDALDQKIDGIGPQGMVDTILKMKAKNHGLVYKIVSFSGRLAAHAIAVRVHESEGIILFDPNFGEFVFPDKARFRRWFIDAYWFRSGYRLPIVGLSVKFSVLPFLTLPKPQAASR